MKSENSGRSMIEMLGVLAIVGILSIGGIRGYEHTMLKYKLIKQTEHFNELFNVMDTYLNQLIYADKKFVSLIPVFEKIGAIPTGWQIKNDYIYDEFNHHLAIKTNDCTPACKGTVITYYMSQKVNFAICNNLMQLAISNSYSLNRYHTQYTTDDSPSAGYANTFYGDNACYGTRKCIRDITITDIVKMCKTCEEKKTCAFIFAWDRDR